MRTAIIIIILVLVAAVATVVYRAQPTKDVPNEDVAPALAPKAVSNAPPFKRQSRFPGYVSIDAKDPQFVQRVLPVIGEFFATLDRAGVNPLKGEIHYNKVQIDYGPHGMGCRFLIGDNWTAHVYTSDKFSVVMQFSERGPDNPFRAISSADTNALLRLSQRAIKMPEAEAERIINHVADAFGIDRSKFEKPEIYPEQMFEYDLGMYTVRYRKKGSDPVHQSNYPISFSIRVTSPTNAVLVMYADSGEMRSGKL